jgi:hypothetical protein
MKPLQAYVHSEEQQGVEVNEFIAANQTHL